MPLSTIDKLLTMPNITDKALDKALSEISKDGTITPAEMKELQKLAALPDDRFASPPETGSPWFTSTRELESMLAAKDIVNAQLVVKHAPQGISVSMAEGAAIKDEDAGGGFVRIYARELVVKIADAKQAKDDVLDLTYGGYVLRVPVKKGEDRDSLFSKIETRLLRQQGAIEVHDGGKRMGYSITNVRSFGREGANQAAARIEKEDSRFVRTLMGSVVDPAPYRKATPGENAFAASVTGLLSSSAMSAAALLAVRQSAEKGGLTATEVDQLVRVAVQPRARVAGKEDGAAYAEMARLHGLVLQARPILAAGFKTTGAPANVKFDLSSTMTKEKTGEDEAGDIEELARTLVITVNGSIAADTTLVMSFNGREAKAKLKKGMTETQARDAIADVTNQFASLTSWKGNTVTAFISFA